MSRELQILSEVKLELGIEGLTNLESLPLSARKLKQQHDLLNQVCESIAKALGFDHFDDEQILLKIERLQETDEGNGYWHKQYTELLKEFRAYTSDSGAHVAYKYLNEIVGALGLDSFRYCDLSKEVIELKNKCIADDESIKQFRDVLEELQAQGIVITALIERIKKLSF
jgi:hypothetical protein